MRTGFVLFLGFLGTSLLFGQTEITVQANRLPESPDTVGASVTVIHPTEDLVDALGKVPGLVIHNEGGGPYVSPAGFGETGFARLTVLVDGVPYNNPDLAPPDLNSIPWQDVDRVEVYSNSVWWGGLGTVINIITKRPAAKFSGEIGAGVDNRLGHDEYARVSVPGGKNVVLTLEAANNRTVSAQASNDSWTPSAGLGLAWGGDGFNSVARYSYSRRLFDLPGSLDQSQFEADPNQVGSYGSTENVLVENRASMTTNGTAFGGTFDLPLGIFGQEVDSFSHTILTQGTGGFHDKWTIPLNGDDYASVQAGIDENQSNYLNHTQTMTAGGVGGTLSWNKDAYLFEAVVRPQIFTNDGDVRGEAPFSGSLIWNTAWTHAKLTAAHTVRVPLLDEQYSLYGSPTFLDNPSLVPETGTLLDAGLDADLDRWSFRFAPTLMWLRDEITENSAETQNVNLSGISRHLTIIVGAGYRITDWAKVSSSYTFTDARDSSGNELPLISTHTVRAGLDTDWGGVDWTYFSPYDAFSSSASSTVVAERNQVGAYLQYAFPGGWKVKATGTNLLDDRTPSEVFNDGWYPSEARTFAVDASWAF